MTKPASSLRKPVTSLLLLSAVLFGAGLSGSTQSAVSADEAKSVGGSVVAAAGDWQRPAPITWSARSETRWNARWGAAPKYIV